MPLLDVESVSVRFGGINALSDVSFSVMQGSVCGLIGPNGAGKTTLFNVVCGIYRAASGSVTFEGRQLLGRRSDQIVSAGIARTFQNVGLFPGLTVKENVMMGAYHVTRPRWRQPLRRHEADVRDRADHVIEQLDLGSNSNRAVGDLGIGTLKRVELARALMTEATLLMLDEPANGLTLGEADELGDLILRIRTDFAMTILLVEHHMRTVMRVCDWVVALDAGRNLVEGSPRDIQQDPKLIEAYLGAPA